MSEPTSFADRVDEVVPGILHWGVQDDRISFRSDAYAVHGPEGLILIDPLPLSDAALESLGAVAAACLTAGQHQRSAWTIRRRLGIPVHAPEGAAGLEESPDAWYVDGDTLPGGLRTVGNQGFGTVHCSLLLDHERGRALFSGDLVVRPLDDGPFGLIPSKYVEDSAKIQESVVRLLDHAPVILCPAHGGPASSDGGAHLQQALAADGTVS